MKISYKRLKQFIHLDESPEEVAELLTSIGLEVEGIESFESLPGGLNGLVVGRVEELWRHPNADKLSCTRVDIGTGELLPIVCGAPNVAVGQKVIVATVGTVLHPTDGESFKINKAKIRGEESRGMICAEDEIGMGMSHDGIMVLPEDTPVGMPAAELFALETDHVFEIGLTPNRADAASHLGVARDLRAALLHRKGKKSELCMPSIDAFEPTAPFNNIKVSVENEEACPRYAGVTVSGIAVAPSPAWLQNFLKSIGVRPINNVVDITNYINHSFGQPLHAFDADKIKGGSVVVKTLPEGTKFTTLDGQERSLKGEDLMICDASHGMCIAGVFGGISSGVDENTKNIFIESAYFNPVWVRRTAKRHALNTDASFRFERGIDPNITAYAARLAALMVVELAGGVISSELSDTRPEGFEGAAVKYSPAKANALIGMDIPEAATERILGALGIDIMAKKEGAWHLNVPAYKVDVLREADVVEEVLRIFGYDEVPVPTKVLSTISDLKATDRVLAREAVSGLLTANGFLECMSNSMTDAQYASLSADWRAEEVVQINNPLSQDLGIMRPTLLFSALQNAAYNLNRQQNELRLFEFGNVYRVGEEVFKEEERLGILVSGHTVSNHWRVADLPADWYELKAALELIFQRLGIEFSAMESTETAKDWFAYGMDWKIKGTSIISAGALSPKLKKYFDIKKDVFYLEMSWNKLVALRKKEINIGQLPKYPEVRRDLALLVDEKVTYAALENLAYSTERKLLRSVALFDVYHGKGMPDGKKSYALKFSLRDDSKTLTDQEVDLTMKRLLQAFEKELGANIR